LSGSPHHHQQDRRRAQAADAAQASRPLGLEDRARGHGIWRLADGPKHPTRAVQPGVGEHQHRRQHRHGRVQHEPTAQLVPDRHHRRDTRGRKPRGDELHEDLAHAREHEQVGHHRRQRRDEEPDEGDAQHDGRGW
jgi:hypothetical protein